MRVYWVFLLMGGWLTPFGYGQSPVVYDLEDCVRGGLKRNLALQNLGLDVVRADADVALSRSVYDSRVAAVATYEDSELPNQNVPVQGATKSLVFGGGYARRLTSGTGLNLEANSARIDFAEAISPVNPLHISSLRLNLEQPLRGGGAAEDQARIQVAESNRDTIALQFYVQQDQVAAGIENAYWLGFLARTQYEVNQEVLRRARVLLETNRARYEEGLLDETDILAAEAALALRDVEVINLRNASAVAEDLLRERMNLPADAWHEVTFAYPDPRTLDVAADPALTAGAEATALEHRPELFLLRASIRRAEDEVALRREEMKGEFAVTGSLGVGETADAWGDSLDPGKSLWGVGVRYESTLGRDAERSRLRKAEVETRRERNQYLDAQRTVVWQTRRAVRTLETAVQRVAATGKARELQRRKLELEEKKFDQGRSTTRTVIEYQDDLALSEFQEVEALVRHRLALVELRLAEGTIVDKPALWSPEEPGP